MPIPMTEHKSESSSIDAPATGKADAAVDRNAKSAQTDPASKPVTLGSQRRTRRRRLLLGVLGVLVLTAALWFGIPYILLTLNTVSTDDAFVNGHVTFVAARVRGQISRVLVDDNNRVRKGDVLVELDKEPYRDAVAVKKAAVDTAQADLRAAMAQAHRRADIGETIPKMQSPVIAAIRLTGGYGTSSVRLVHSGLIFAARITLAHFSVSAAISLPKSAGEPAITVPPRSANDVALV